MTNLVLSAVVVTAVTSAVNFAVMRTLDPVPAGDLGHFAPAQNAREIFEGELRSVTEMRGGLQSALYADVMRKRGAADALYARGRWVRAQAGYATLSREIANSCHGHHPTMTAIPGLCLPSGDRATGSPEASREATNTWTNYTYANGALGPAIAEGATVEVACKVYGLAAADGNMWWYRIASAPWSGRYYVSADAFYNRKTSRKTGVNPLVDVHIRNCSSF